jgi:hypothetical protein
MEKLLRWREGVLAKSNVETHQKAALDTGVRAVRWVGSIALVRVHTGRRAVADLYAGCLHIDLACLVTQAYATYWCLCSAGSDSEAAVNFEHVNLVTTSSCYDQEMAMLNRLNLKN